MDRGIHFLKMLSFLLIEDYNIAIANCWVFYSSQHTFLKNTQFSTDRSADFTRQHGMPKNCFFFNVFRAKNGIASSIHTSFFLLLLGTNFIFLVLYDIYCRIFGRKMILRHPQSKHFFLTNLPNKSLSFYQQKKSGTILKDIQILI